MITGGPGTKDPGQITYSRVTLQLLIREAYAVQFDQISGPNWIDNEGYTIVAKVPPGATKEQVGVMLQNLLANRFKLTLHRQKKRFPVYALVVAETGQKLKESADANAVPLRPGYIPKVDRDGFPQLPTGTRGTAGNPLNGIMHYTFRGQSISDLVLLLTSSFGAVTGSNTWAPGRLVDQTGLTGRYDFTLAYAGTGQIGGALSPPDLFADQGVSGPSLTEALEKQLGLKLKKTNAELDVLVIDHAERVPDEN
jgi:uncharacterized protein (TIGR03435 family)